MWVCPKCKREFKRTNQGHYCGKAPENVDEYIISQPPETHDYITALRNLILRCSDGAEEKISWSMPVYKKADRSVSFAACKNHISLYIGSPVPESAKERLSGFTIKKNALCLPYGKTLPEEVIEDMIKEIFEKK